jgi:hypothetical protein
MYTFKIEEPPSGYWFSEGWNNICMYVCIYVGICMYGILASFAVDACMYVRTYMCTTCISLICMYVCMWCSI